MSVVKKQRLVSFKAALLALAIVTNTMHAQWPTNSRNDPFKVFTSVDPQYFLYEREKQLMFGMPDEKGTPERVMISLSPFGQNANYAKPLDATYCPPDAAVDVCFTGSTTSPCNTIGCSSPPALKCPPCINSVPLGDIDGRWNLLGLLAGQIPAGIDVSSIPLLSNAFSVIFPNSQPGTITSSMIEEATQDPNCKPLVGYVSVPLKYRKKGIRWDVEAQICGDFGLQFEGGVVEISQVLSPCFNNLTLPTSSLNPCVGNSISGTNINCALFDPLVPLAKQLGMDICNFTKWGIEDLYLALYWRHAHTINFNRDLSWARMLLIPFIRAGGSIATGHVKDPSVIFSLPFGNNGSNAVNFSAGMNFDFVETVEIGTEVGYSHFFKKDFDNYRAPTNVLQSGIFPYSTPACVQPGDTAFVAGKLAAYHFIDRLSFVFQWVYVHHRKDHVKLINPDPAFIDIDDNNPLAKCHNTAWRAQLGNFAFTYDVSPNLGLGFLWQQMFHVRNVYNSTTVMFTLNLIF